MSAIFEEVFYIKALQPSNLEQETRCSFPFLISFFYVSCVREKVSKDLMDNNKTVSD